MGVGTLFHRRCHREDNHRLRTLGYMCAQRRGKHVSVATHVGMPHMRRDKRSQSCPVRNLTNTGGENTDRFAWTITPTGYSSLIPPVVCQITGGKETGGRRRHDGACRRPERGKMGTSLQRVRQSKLPMRGGNGFSKRWRSQHVLHRMYPVMQNL